MAVRNRLEMYFGEFVKIWKRCKFLFFFSFFFLNLLSRGGCCFPFATCSSK